MSERERLISLHGGYRRLKSFQIAQLVYDVTVRFCERPVERFSRTRDQMVQAARSGVQNIAEGSQASVPCRRSTNRPAWPAISPTSRASPSARSVSTKAASRCSPPTTPSP